ncbi:plasminogen-binding protein pgbB [Helicobacter saguini]|uniref:Plasminogen-binding protein pgbB n=1 Tax=Helicobacter saguini TaxID=1548018 RepID=A0A347W4D2_9HELI|nr:hypothetical protein [Helicobacter saguini]MWV61891.1 plasminogen-binding protein pgbB [Helicobacter saguini]MWV67434.1 plasminogen-binding protein pgbB [Helicobacter saguini]MWV69787.1 plasminogen-binding protein pgbB [Helicobacter saguini]MWV72996.1 plasminogen-binding protein pgbB [Helicobacter saguini]TLD95624.1 plasminogen-binding protein pgbB [Helicobacter saguini]
MKILNIFTFLLLFLIVNVFNTGCDSQKSFKPQILNGKASFNDKIDKNIIATNRIAAKLKNGYIITHESVEQVLLSENENLLYADSKQWILTDGCKGVKIIPINNPHFENIESSLRNADNSKDSKTIDSNNNHKITLQRDKTLEIPTNGCVVAASIKNNLLAGMLGDNTAFLYDISTKTEIFRDKGEGVYAISSNIANPVFMDTLVIFPTLDGRLNTIDLNTLKSVRNIIVNTDKFLNNIIYLKVSNDELVAATQKKIYSLIKGESYNKDIELRDLLFDGKFVYVLSLNGYIYKLDKTLGEVRSVKLPYANLNGLILKNNKLYTYENSGGYLIELDLDSFSYNSYKMRFGMESMLRIFSKKSSIFYVDDRIYINKKVLDLNKKYDVKLEEKKKK